MTPMIVEHPLLQHKLSILRNKQTGTKEFRDLVGEIATLLCYEATRDLPLEEVEIETPITMAKTKVLAGRKLALVPILRAGMGMLDGMLTLLPAAKVGLQAPATCREIGSDHTPVFGEPAGEPLDFPNEAPCARTTASP